MRKLSREATVTSYLYFSCSPLTQRSRTFVHIHLREEGRAGSDVRACVHRPSNSPPLPYPGDNFLPAREGNTAGAPLLPYCPSSDVPLLCVQTPPFVASISLLRFSLKSSLFQTAPRRLPLERRKRELVSRLEATHVTTSCFRRAV